MSFLRLGAFWSHIYFTCFYVWICVFQTHLIFMSEQILIMNISSSMCHWNSVKYQGLQLTFAISFTWKHWRRIWFIVVLIVWVSAHIWRSEDKLCGSFSPSTMCAWGTKLGSSGLVVSSSIHWGSQFSLCLVLVTGKHQLSEARWKVSLPFYFMELFKEHWFSLKVWYISFMNMCGLGLFVEFFLFTNLLTSLLVIDLFRHFICIWKFAHFFLLHN